MNRGCVGGGSTASKSQLPPVGSAAVAAEFCDFLLTDIRQRRRIVDGPTGGLGQPKRERLRELVGRRESLGTRRPGSWVGPIRMRWMGLIESRRERFGKLA